MNRTDRLYAMSEELRRRGKQGVTAADLADRFEVSVRTVKRDVSALQQAGMAIWAQTGVGGGYFLADSADLPPINFTSTQAAAVTLALAALPDGSPFAADIRAASAKILDALTEPDRQRAEALAGRLWVLAPDDSVTTNAPTRHAIETALVEHRALSIVYRSPTEPIKSAGKRVGKRVVEPIIMAATAGAWYLVAHCRLRNDIRWFRVDRIESADLTNQRYRPRPVADIGTPPDQARPALRKTGG